MKLLRQAACCALLLVGTSPAVWAESGTAVTNPRLEADWSREAWQAQGGLFFSGYRSVDAMLKGRAQADNPAPLTPEYAQKAAELKQKGLKDRAAVDPMARCLPLGTPQVFAAPWPFKFQFSPGLLVWLSESGFRKVYFDGAQPPVSDEYTNTRYGHSNGWWEGDTLVIKTVTLRGDAMLEPGVPHSWQLEVLQKWRQIGRDQLEVELTMTDPLALTRPWVVHKRYQRVSDSKVREKQCI